MGVSSLPPDRILIVWEPTSTPPAGYVKANGAALSRSVYAWLFGRIGTTWGVGDGSTTFNVPDLRGEFLRGLDDGRGVDTGRVLATAQASQNLSHNHGGATGSATDNYSTAVLNGTSAGDNYASVTASMSHAHAIAADGGTEARPRNVAGLYCIAYAG